MQKSSVRLALRVEEFDALVPEHLFSVLDDEACAHDDDGALMGTTEWSAPWQGRQLSFGLDVGYHPERQYVEARWSTLRTNAMVVDEAGAELALNDLRWCVARMLTRVRWESVVLPWLHTGDKH
jgi:hypothetical protein